MAKKKINDPGLVGTGEEKAVDKVTADSQDSRQRLWDSLNTTYGLRRQDSNESYDQAIAQADRQALSRGMQRSSYNNATLANLNAKKADASDRIYAEQVAAYQQGSQTIEQQDKEDEWRERQFAEQQRQFDQGQAFTAEQNALNRAFTTSEREATQGYQSAENALNRAFSTSEREATQAFQTGEREATQGYQSAENALNRAFQTSEREATQGFQAGENALNRAFTTSEREASQAFQAGENALNRGQSQQQFNAQLDFQKSEAERNQQNTDWQQAFSERQWEAQQAQWREQFEYDKMSTEEKLAYNYVLQAINAGGDVSDELLNRAGITRADYNAMKMKTSGGGGSPKKTEEEGAEGGVGAGGVNGFLNSLFGNNTGGSTGGKDRIRNDTSGSGSTGSGLFSTLANGGNSNAVADWLKTHK